MASPNGATPALAGADMTGSGSDLGLTTSRMSGSTQGVTTSTLSIGGRPTTTTTPTATVGGGANPGGATSAGGGTTSGGIFGGTTTDATTAMSVVRQAAGPTGNGILGGPSMGRGPRRPGSSGSATWPASSWAPRITASPAPSTAGPRSA